MGNNSANLTQKTKISNDWTIVEKNNDGSNVLKNSIGEYADQYSIPFDRRLNMQEQLEIYYFRKIQSFSLVKILGVHIYDSTTSTFCGSEKTSRILTERISNRLSTISQITFLQAQYMLVQSLKGYKEVYKRTGYFQVNENMIGITPEGFVRVWINENFSLNHPASQKFHSQTTNTYQLDYSSKKDEHIFISNILKIIEKHCQNGTFPPEFKTYYKSGIQNQNLTFSSAQSSIYNFIISNDIKLPDRINLKKNSNSVQVNFIKPILASSNHQNYPVNAINMNNSNNNMNSRSSLAQSPINIPQIPIVNNANQQQSMMNSNIKLDSPRISFEQNLSPIRVSQKITSPPPIVRMQSPPKMPIRTTFVQKPMNYYQTIPSNIQIPPNIQYIPKPMNRVYVVNNNLQSSIKVPPIMNRGNVQERFLYEKRESPIIKSLNFQQNNHLNEINQHKVVLNNQQETNIEKVSNPNQIIINKLPDIKKKQNIKNLEQPRILSTFDKQLKFYQNRSIQQPVEKYSNIQQINQKHKDDKAAYENEIYEQEIKTNINEPARLLHQDNISENKSYEPYSFMHKQYEPKNIGEYNNYNYEKTNDQPTEPNLRLNYGYYNLDNYKFSNSSAYNQ